jgi:hypothetical protein
MGKTFTLGKRSKKELNNLNNKIKQRNEKEIQCSMLMGGLWNNNSGSGILG